MAPLRTLERLRPVLAQVGVTRVAVITGLDDVGIPVVMVCRPNGRSLSVSQGKGVDLSAAKVSGIMEAVEAWHAEQVCFRSAWAPYRELSAWPRRRRRAASPTGPGRGSIPISRSCGSRVRICSPRIACGCRTSACTSTTASPASRHGLLPRQRQRPGRGQPRAGGREPRALARWSSATRSPCGMSVCRRTARRGRSTWTASRTPVAGGCSTHMRRQASALSCRI